MDQTRIAELRRRLQADPTSIAFAQLAEEHRRAGQLDEAVAVCREGLERHPGYLSAHVTLGRALAELGQIADAEREFEQVLHTSPDNLAAIRGIGEIHQKQGRLDQALAFYRRALSLARYDPELDETVQAIARELGDDALPETRGGLSFEQAERELLEAPSRVFDTAPAVPRVDFDELLRSLGHEPDRPAPAIVEAWLSNTPTPPVSVEPQGGSKDPPLRDAYEGVRRGGSLDPPGPAAAHAPEPVNLGTDLLARLEAELRQLERRPPPTVAQYAAAHPADPRIDPLVVAELERWLAAIAVRRRTLTGRV